MRAFYQMTDEQKINELLAKATDDVFEAIEELSEIEEEFLDIDKLWDGLHFLLTNRTAAEPLKDNPLSEAILGAKNFLDDEDTDFVAFAYILPQRVFAIINALNSFDIEHALETFQPKKFALNDIYPDIWLCEDKIKLQEELEEQFFALKKFYETAGKLDKGVIVSIS